MKKLLLFFSVALISTNICSAQDWFTSFDIAKRLAIVQDKMLFVLWEGSLDYPYPILYNTENGKSIVIDLSVDESLDSVIWEHFVPVLLPESKYDELIKEAKGRGVKYVSKLNDDSIKIMDVNGKILNTRTSVDDIPSLTKLIKKYSLSTSFLKQDLINYSKQENFTTAYNLASKYMDYAIFAPKNNRKEIIALANIYFDEAKNHIAESNLEKKSEKLQRIKLIKIKEYLILNNPRKANRHLKKIDPTQINKINESLYSSLKYTVFKLLKDEDNAALWKSKISLVDLKKAKYILNINSL